MDKTALLVIDIQVRTIAKTTPETLSPSYLPLLAKTINSARSSSVKIIYVAQSFQAGHPEVSSSNKTWSGAKKGNVYVRGSPETEIHPSIAPIPGDVLVEKKRVSAFTGSGLDIILRSLGVQTLVLAGLSTGGGVLSTLCDAADRDFEIVVLKDLCADKDQGVHEMLMQKIFTKRGDVVGAEEWLEGLKA